MLAHLKEGSLRDPDRTETARVLSSVPSWRKVWELPWANDPSGVAARRDDAIRPAHYEVSIPGGRNIESGFFELDENWAYTSLHRRKRPESRRRRESHRAERRRLYQAPEIARPRIALSERSCRHHWMEQNQPILGALKMERVVTVITIGLIELVARSTF